MLSQACLPRFCSVFCRCGSFWDCPTIVISFSARTIIGAFYLLTSLPNVFVLCHVRQSHRHRVANSLLVSFQVIEFFAVFDLLSSLGYHSQLCANQLHKLART